MPNQHLPPAGIDRGTKIPQRRLNFS